MRVVLVVGALALGCSTGAFGSQGQGAEKTLKATVVQPETRTTVAEANAEASSGTDGFEAMVCKQSGHIRRVEVKVEDEETRVPCAVHYQKETESPGHDQVLWTAKSEAGYCERKAQDFVQKLQGWGWSCQQRTMATTH